MTENSTDSSRIIELMAKRLGQHASVEELKELERLMAANPTYAWLGEIVGSLKGSPEHFERNIPGEELVDSGWRQLAGRLKADGGAGAGEGEIGSDAGVLRIGMRSIWKWVAAAVVVVLVGGGSIWYFLGDRNPFRVKYTDKVLEVGYGGRSKLVLGDGTTVWLNAGSRLIYPDVFAGDRREVTLEGEAFFDVPKHVSMPFLVHAGKITVKVLGTRFDIKAYKEDAELSTTLISGKIQVTLDGDPEKKVILKPHEMLTVVNSPLEAADAGRGVVTGKALRYVVQGLPEDESDSLPEAAWVENRLVVNDITFEELARTLERRYDVRIDFEDERLKSEHLSGVFEKETIQQVLDILQQTTKFKYSIVGKKVRLMPDL
jgi:ferric-dicitrate binding protein FerR (iron transport regulator)